MGKVIGSNQNLDLSIYFESNKYRINFEERKKLDKVALFMKDNPTIKSMVTEHTDPTAGTKYNMVLSLRRARATANYLSIKGIDKKRLFTKGKGETDLIYKSLVGDGYGDKNNIVNRRTTIKVVEY